MTRQELAKVITEVIWSDFEAIQDCYIEDDKQRLEDEMYEVLENFE